MPNSFSERLYSALLCSYPADMRLQFGDEMLEVFSFQLRKARERNGRFGQLCVWCCVARESLWEAVSSKRQIAAIFMVSGLFAMGLMCGFLWVAFANPLVF